MHTGLVRRSEISPTLSPSKGNAPDESSRTRVAPLALAERTAAETYHRLAILDAYDILESPPEALFDDIAVLASQACDTPVAAISFVTDSHQWFKAEIGLGVRETPIELSVCDHTMRQSEVLVIADLREDERFAMHEWVTGARQLRFYAGAPLITAEGIALGALCVFDSIPRTLTLRQIGILKVLSRHVMSHLNLRRTLKLSEKADRQRARKMAIAGHDLKQPLQVAMINAELIVAQPEKNVPLRLQTIIVALKKIGEGLDSLARDSATTNDDESPRLQRFRLGHLLSPLADVWRTHAAQKNIALTVINSSVDVETDYALMATVLSNLVGNAIKYTPAGGRVTVGVRRGGKFAQVQVIDTGVGMALESQAKLFEPFVQGDSDVDGLGLGLSIVRHATDLLGHELRVSSREGGGSKISVYVPIAAASAHAGVTGLALA